ncbi:MAG: sulfatase-like hydrolase/transferase [Planctomycetota bacterium]|nr:sulfatase-like hydrolase/transferase [Planctomycetota bacterium]MDA0933922.1 sulfatase-like hydrolase/transferase [Planctomycetota bacterium]
MRRKALPALGLLLSSLCPGQAAVRPPNVVVVLVDDLGWADLGCQGSTFYETPNIDRLAADGARFTNGYAAAAVCSPTRAAVQTGRAPARTGVTDWIRARFQRGGLGTPDANPTELVATEGRPLLCPPNPFWLEHDELTIAEMLRVAGYATGHIGKWHLGDDAWYPERQGYDENFGGCDYGQPPSYFDPYTNQRLPQGIPGLPGRKAGEFLTTREADEAVGFVARHRDRPFFLHYAPYAVHTPIQAEPEVAARYAAKPNESAQKNAKYAALVDSVDRAVGRILGALDEQGVAERTLVVFTSDNGGLLGPTDNSPLRSGKGYPYEGGLRVPFVVRWPGVVAPGTVSDLPVTSVDLMPTIVEAVGLLPPATRELDGRSLVAHLRTGEGFERPLFWHFPHYRGRDNPPFGVVREGSLKLIERYEDSSHELYDLAADPGETKDLSGERPVDVRRLSTALHQHLADVGARVPVRAAGDRPRVLILGDSISIGYLPHLREILGESCETYRPIDSRGRPENCQGTTYGVENLERWLAHAGGGWDVIHFNFGLHDLKRVHPDTGASSPNPAHARQAEPDVYEAQLRRIVGRLAESGSKLIFATTTPVPEGDVRPHRDVEDAGRYNAIARRVVAEHGIAVDDLYAFAAPRLGEIQKPVDVHFTKEGSAALAAEVARHVLAALEAR